MAETQTVAKKSPPKSREEKRAEFEQWERDREVRDLRKAVKTELAILAKKLDECKTTDAIREEWIKSDRLVDVLVGTAKDDSTPKGA